MSIANDVILSEVETNKTHAASDRPVDLVQLSRYTLGNRSLEGEVLQLFLTQSKLYLSRLQEAKDDKAWRDAAHTIKGSARGIGAWQVADCAEEAEKLADSGHKNGRSEAILALEELVDATNSYIELLLTEH